MSPTQPVELSWALCWVPRDTSAPVQGCKRKVMGWKLCPRSEKFEHGERSLEVSFSGEIVLCFSEVSSAPQALPGLSQSLCLHTEHTPSRASLGTISFLLLPRMEHLLKLCL